MSSKQKAANTMRFFVTEPMLDPDEETIEQAGAEYERLQKIMVAVLDMYEQGTMALSENGYLMFRPNVKLNIDPHLYEIELWDTTRGDKDENHYSR